MSSDDQPALLVNGDVATLKFPGDAYILDFRGISPDQFGRLFVEVTARHGEQPLHKARIDLLNQRDQEAFHQRCVAVNSNTADWQSRLQSAIPGVQELAQTQHEQTNGQQQIDTLSRPGEFSRHAHPHPA